MAINYKYLIIGGGMTADATVHGIRQIDSDGSVGIISLETHEPYDRPPLTKGLWKGKSLDTIWRHTADLNVQFHLGTKCQSIDPVNKRVSTDNGNTFEYTKLLLATGGSPKQLPSDTNDIIYFRTLDDYQRLRELTTEKKRFAVIGGGFIGTEITAALAMNGKEVVMIFPGNGIGGSMFPTDLAVFLSDYYHQQGVELKSQAKVVNVKKEKSQFVVKTRNIFNNKENEIKVDAVVAGLGIKPNIELAQQTGLAVNDGIRVDSALRTSYPDIYAAGDVAEFYNPTLDRHIRVEHEDNANTMGETVGKSMAGEAVSYDHLPFFYSDLFDLGYEAVGQIDPNLEIVTDWKEPYHEGVVYYMEKGRVRGVLLWNVWQQVEAARRLIAETGPFRPEELKGRLLESHQYV